MQESTTKQDQVVQFRHDIRRLLQDRVLKAVEVVLEEELSEALGSDWYQRGDARRGYRHGTEERRITTAAGTREVKVPRGRLLAGDGSTKEFHSGLLPRYARRTRRSAFVSRRLCHFPFSTEVGTDPACRSSEALRRSRPGLVRR